MAYTLVQSKATAINSSDTTIPLAFDSNVAAGNMLLAMVIAETADVSISVADSQGNTWTQITGASVAAAPGFSPSVTAKIAFFRASAGSSAADTVTATFGSGVFRAIAIFEVSGQSSPSDGDASSGSGTSSVPDAGSLTVNDASNIVLLANEGQWGTALSPPSGFTEIYDNNNFLHPWFAYALNQAAGSLSTAGGTSTSAWVALGAVVEESGGGGGVVSGIFESGVFGGIVR